MSVKTRYDANDINGEFYESTSGEVVLAVAPVSWKDDFLGKELALTETGSTGPWDVVEVGLNASIALAADIANGAVDLIIDVDNNAEDAVLYWGDQRGISVKQGTKVEFILTFTTISTGPTVVFGLAGNHNLDKDSVTEHAWFRLNGDGVLKCETDDTTNDNNDIDASKTLVAATYNVFQIDFTDLTDVKFSVDGTQVATGTTFDMSNLTDSEAVMQLYISLDKGADTTEAALRVDKVYVWGSRS